MKPISGLNRDVSLFNQPENSYRYADNAMVSESLGNLESVPTDLQLSSFPATFMFCGWHLVDETVLAVGWDTSALEGQIWELQISTAYVPALILTDPFDVWELSQEESATPGIALGEFQFAWSKDSANRRQFVWAPISSQPKFVNIDRLLLDTVNNPAGVLGTAYTRKAFLLFPEAYLPSPNITVIEDGGTVSSGCYFFMHKYEYIDGSATDWSAPSNPAYIVADTAESSTLSADKLYGDEGDRVSPKSISILLDLDNEQPPETFVRIGYISYRGGVIFAGILTRISLDSVSENSGVFLFSGQQLDIDLGDDISELITPKAHYRKIRTLTSLTNRLYVGNLVESTNLLFQDIANASIVDWYIVDTIAERGIDSRIRDKTYQVKVPTFGPGEVYAFYLHFLKKDGTESRAFHIPGRKYQEAVAPIPEVTATGTYQVLGGPSAGGFAVGFQHGSFILSIFPANGDTNLVTVTNLVAFINGSAVPITATDAGLGLITLLADVTGLSGNLGMFELANDPAFTTNLTGMTGGTDLVIGEIADDEPTIVPPGDTYPRYQVEDTVRPFDEFSGEMGYWANPDERYPSSSDFDSAKDPGSPFEDNVRHHRFPTLKWLWDNSKIPSEPDNFGPNMQSFILLDIRVTVDINDQSLVDDIDGFYISYAKKTIGDTITVGTQVMVPMGKWNADGGDKNVYKPTCGPWDIGAVPLDDKLILEGGLSRWHGLNMVQNFVSIDPKYVDIIRTYENHAVSNVLIGESELYWPSTVANPTIPGDRVSLKDAYRYGILESIQLIQSAEIANPVERLGVTDFAYVRNGTKLNIGGFSVDNMVGEDCLITSLNPDLPISDPAFIFENDPAAIWTWAFASLMTIPTNIAFPFTNQSLVYCAFERVTSVDVYVANNANKSADFFHAYMQFNTTGPVSGTVNTTTDEAGIFRGEGMKIGYQSLTVGPINHNAQYFELGEFNSYISPIQGTTGISLSLGDTEALHPASVEYAKTWHFWDQDIYKVQNKFYNPDFNRLREFFIQDIYDGVPIVNNEFPVTISFSLQQIADSPVANWRTWLVNNKYTQPVYAGDIINLEGAGNQKLYIHQRYSLFLTKDRTTLKGTVEVTLGSSDIFEVTPFEIVTVDEGHTGLGRREWADMTIMGYVWANHDHGKIFLHTGEKLEEISSNGMRLFFRDFMDKDSSFGSSFTFVYDEDRKRLMLTCFGEATEQRFTLSYSSMTNTWISFHDRAYFNAIPTRRKGVLFRDFPPVLNVLVDGGITPSDANPLNISGLAEGPYGNYDNDPFIIEVVANLNDVSYKYIKGIMWSSEVFNTLTDIEDYEETFKKIFIYSGTKTAGETDLVPYTTFPLEPPQNVRRLEKNWFFNEFRDLWNGVDPIVIDTIANRLGPNSAAADPSIPWYDQGRIRDKTFLIRLTYDDIGTDNKFVLSGIDFDFKESKR